MSVTEPRDRSDAATMDSFDEPRTGESADTASRPRPLQFGLRGLLLVTALVAVWGTDYLNRQSIARIESQLPALQRMAAELVVDDPSLITIVQQPPLWWDENIWHVYLPGSDFLLHLASEMIDDAGTAPIDASVPLPQGTMKIELRQQRSGDDWRLSVLLDDQEVMAMDKPAEWHPGAGSSGGPQFSTHAEKQADEPVIMFRRRFYIPSGDGVGKSPDGPAAGVLLWIEPAAATAD